MVNVVRLGTNGFSYYVVVSPSSDVSDAAITITFCSCSLLSH